MTKGPLLLRLLALVALILISCAADTSGDFADIGDCRLRGKVVDRSGNGRAAEIGVVPDPTIGTDEGFVSQPSRRFDIPFHCGETYSVIANTVRLKSAWHEVTIEQGVETLELVLDRALDA